MLIPTIIKVEEGMLCAKDNWRELHSKYEGIISQELLGQGRKIQIVNSAQKVRKDGDAYWETVFYSGFTTAPDMMTVIRTYENGRLENFSTGLR